MKFVYSLVLLISRLPFWVLYLVADFIYFILRFFLKYRKKVIDTNLRNSFPGISAVEIKQIRNNFYRHFADYLVELIKLFTAEHTTLNHRIEHKNLEVFEAAKMEGKNVILLTGHIFNWEWYTALRPLLPQKQCYPVYRNLQNLFWREKINQLRSRFGNEPLEAAVVIRHILRQENNGESVYMFIADQSPHQDTVDFGVQFLSQMTPAFIGYDKLAVKKDFHFIYCQTSKLGRGNYQFVYERILPENGQNFAEYELVKKFHQKLEENILQDKANYLWSHRKWKYADRIKPQNGQKTDH